MRIYKAGGGARDSGADVDLERLERPVKPPAPRDIERMRGLDTRRARHRETHDVRLEREAAPPLGL